MPLGPFKVEYIRASADVPQREGYSTKAVLLNAPQRKFLYPVAGTSYKQPALVSAAQLLRRPGQLERRAELIYENHNKFDPLAVAVYICGEQVGYLPKCLCKEYREALSYVIPKEMPHIPMFCPFILVGGAPGEYIGVRLSLPWNE